ncbi:MAG: glycosyltransferase family 87 protein [Acidimicrobiia bacterium]
MFDRSSATTARALAFAPLVAALISTIEFARVIAVVGRKIANPDTSVLWYASQEWSHLRWHEPGFLGQSYGSTIAGAPIALLHQLGLGYPTATPIVLGASMLGLWFALAWAFARRRHPIIATVTAAMPTLLSAYYAMYITSVTFERAFVFTGVGLAFVIAYRRSAFALAAGVTLAGLGLAIDLSAALLVVPVGVWWILDRRPNGREWRAVAIGAVVPVLYFGWSQWFYVAHPDHNLHGGLPLTPELSVLRTSVKQLDRLFRLFAPEMLRSFWVPVVVGLVLIAVLVWSRRARFAIPAMLVLVLTLFALATPRAIDEGGPFLPPGRVLLVFPVALVFLGFLLAEAWPGAARRLAPIGAAVIVIAVGLSVGLRWTVDSHDPVRLRNAALTAPLYGFTTVAAVDADCRRLDAFARRTRATLAVLPAGGTLADGCGPLVDSPLHTIDVPYDRRTWELERAATRPSTAALFSPVGPDFCAIASARFDACEREGTMAVVRYPAQPILNVLANLDLPIRPFGDGCVIANLVCSAGTDTRERFPRAERRIAADSPDGVAIADALAGYTEDRAGSAEPGPGFGDTNAALFPLLQGRSLAPGVMRRTGPHTVSLVLKVPSGTAARKILGQMVQRDGRWMLAWSTQCAIAGLNRIPCQAAVPMLFPGSTWRALT